MALFAEREFDPKFKLTPSVKNILIGMVVGAIEAPGDGGPWSVQDLWVQEHVPGTFRPIRALLDHGYLWAQQWSGGPTTIGLTDSALEWMRKTYGLPPGEDQFAVADWIITTLKPQFKRHKDARKMPRTTTEIVAAMSWACRELSVRPRKALYRSAFTLCSPAEAQSRVREDGSARGPSTRRRNRSPSAARAWPRSRRSCVALYGTSGSRRSGACSS